jgi:carbon-monoxide dehydrogenase large subunit
MRDAEQNFLLGAGTYVADMVLPDALHLKIARSVYARARLLRVRGGITGAELKATLTSVGEGAMDGTGVVPYPVLARDRVNYVGQPLAGVLGSTEAEAEDLLDSVDVEYDPLPALVDPEAASGAEPIHPGTRSNVFVEAHVGRKFREPSAPVVLEETLVNERVVPNPLEPRGIVASWDGRRLTVYASTQSVSSFQEGLSESLHLPKASVRVVQMDTGGAFGSKGGIYPEYVVAAYAAMREKRPIRWIETRSEHLQATEQGRGCRARMRVYADRRGRVQALRGDLLVDGGAYSAGMGEFMPEWVGYQLTGPYAIRKAFVEARAVYTNKVPLGPYRGAGRPEAAFFIERMMDFLADEIQGDPVDVRLANASARAFTSPAGIDVPAFRPFLQAAVRNLGYRRRGQQKNTGFSCFVLIPAAGSGEGARIAVQDERVHVWLGGSAHGQGHGVFVRSLLSKALGVPAERVEYERSDTDALDRGVGSWGSRSAIVGGGAVLEAASRIREQVRRKYGRYSPRRLLEGVYDVKVFFRPKGNFNSFGANLVTADLEATGLVRVRECAAYYDTGRVLNRAMVDGQVAGGSLQGIGQVLFEAAVYDEKGNVLTASLADAGLPTAVEAPRYSVKYATSRSNAPHGAKGVGESPAIGVPPALVRAIERQVRRRLTRTPLRPEDLVSPAVA